MAAALGIGAPEQDQAGIVVDSVVTDSRKVVAGCLFVCIVGENFNGHDFAAAAVRAGAAAILASEPPSGMEFGDGKRVPVLLVKETVAALGILARYWRRQSKARVIGITGTAGKTSVKEAVAQILSRQAKTAWNPLNNNNQIGMPCAMLNTDGDEAYWVFEAGISKPGDMDELGSVLEPDVALVLNVGPGHTEGLGERGVAWHKARLLAWLRPGGLAVVNADYPDLVEEAGKYPVRKIWFSTAAGHMGMSAADQTISCHSSGIAEPEKGFAHYSLAWEDGACTILSPFVGAIGAENTGAVFSILHSLGLGADSIEAGFGSVGLPKQRFCHYRQKNWLVIDDSYNANPLSMQRMLDSASGFAAGKDLVLVLGEMGELGSESSMYHRELGLMAAACSPVLIVWKGGHFAELKEGLVSGGFSGAICHVSENSHDQKSTEEKFLQAMIASGLAGGTILFKGSRMNGLEKLVAAFGGWLGK